MPFAIFSAVRRQSGLSLIVFLTIALLFTPAVLAQADGTPVESSGEASVVIFDDLETGRAETRYYLIDEKGKERRLHFKGPPPDAFKTGRKVKVRGHSKDDDIDVDNVQELDGASGAADAGAAAEALAAPETRRILTLLVDFNDAVVTTGTSNGTTVQKVRDRLYNETKSVAGLFFNASLGTLTLDPDGDGDGQQDVFHVTINDSYVGGDAGQCSPSTWVSLASSAWQAANPGKDIGIYQHRLLITPNYWDYGNRHCTWGGVAQVGCGSWCWAIGADPNGFMHGVIVHELGHNLGFNHARTDGNNNGFNSSESTDSEYGDDSDMMGSSRNWKYFNAPHAEDKGWVDPVEYEIRTVVPSSSLQTFDLLPLDNEAWSWPGLRALKLERSSNSDYYVTYRRATGDYNNLDSEYRDRVVIYYGFDNNTYSYNVTSLAAGQSFVDSARDLVITATTAVTLNNGGQSTQAMGVEVCSQSCSSTPAPSNLTAVAVSTSAIDLDWLDNSPDEDGFDIQRSLDGGAWSALTTVGAGQESYPDLGLLSGTDYSYRVRASSPGGDSDWSNVASAKTLGIAPTAAFDFAPSYLQVDFTDLSSDSDGSVVAWSWTFGDGGTSSQRNPSHAYAGAGSYTVSLTATDDDGYSDTANQLVTVFEAPNQPPSADFSFSVNNLSVSFADLSSDADGSIASRSWDFGDGNGSSATNPSHSYGLAGTYDVTLTVTDNDGDSDPVTKQVSVTAPPAYTDHAPVSENPVAGSVSGSLAATAADDESFESITERESGGKPVNRYSYLEHRWTFDIPAGDSATVFVNAWQSASTDGDSFDFAWSSDGSNWVPMFNVAATSDDTPLSFELPAGTSGSISLRVTDTDQGTGHRGLDTVYVDLLRIRVGSGTPQPFDNTAPSGLVAAATSHSVIELTWNDNGSNEAGFEIERSTAGGPWESIDATGPNNDSDAAYTDTGLSGSTPYSYRVRSFKGAEVSEWSQPSASVTTPAEPAIELVATGYKVKGTQTADLSWSGATGTNVIIFRGTTTMTTANDGAFTDDIGNKGGGSYTYQVCETGSSACSNVETVVF